jgi:hypothetical protein
VTGLRFPQELSRMRFQGIREFDDKRLGYCALYAVEGANGQICVYDLGHARLPTGIDGPVFKEALALAIDGFVKALNKPPYANGQVLSQGTPSIEGGGKTARAEMRLLSSELRLPDNTTIQGAHLLLMTAGLGKILKLNYSQRSAAAEAFATETQQIIEHFVRFNGETMKALLLEPAGPAK